MLSRIMRLIYLASGIFEHNLFRKQLYDVKENTHYYCNTYRIVLCGFATSSLWSGIYHIIFQAEKKDIKPVLF